MRFFFSYALSYRQVSYCDRYNCKNNVSKFVWKPFKSPLSLRNAKCFGEASLFNLHNFSFNYRLLAKKIVQFIEDLAVFTALNHSGSFGKNFVKFKKKNKKCYPSTYVGPYWKKTVPLVLSTSRPRAQFFSIWTSPAGD